MIILYYMCCLISGWCYIHAHYDKKSERLGWLFFSYELWVSGSMLWILLMVLVFCIILYANNLKVYNDSCYIYACVCVLVVQERNPNYLL